MYVFKKKNIPFTSQSLDIKAGVVVVVVVVQMLELPLVPIKWIGVCEDVARCKVASEKLISL